MNEEDTPPARQSPMAVGLFLMLAGVVVGYSGLVAMSGVMMLIGAAAGFTGLYAALVGLIRRFTRHE